MYLKGFSLIVILISVLVLFTAVGAGFIIYRDKIPVNKQLEEPKSGEQKEEQIVQKPSQESEIDTSTWKTYRNEKYGFEVKYPPELIAGFFKDGSGIYLEMEDSEQEHPILTIGALHMYMGKSFSEIDDFKHTDLQRDCKIIDFAGVEAYDCTPLITFAGDRTIIFQKQELTFEIFDSLLSTTSMGIISTFKFIK